MSRQLIRKLSDIIKAYNVLNQEWHTNEIKLIKRIILSKSYVTLDSVEYCVILAGLDVLRVDIKIDNILFTEAVDLLGVKCDIYDNCGNNNYDFIFKKSSRRLRNIIIPDNLFEKLLIQEPDKLENYESDYKCDLITCYERFCIMVDTISAHIREHRGPFNLNIEDYFIGKVIKYEEYFIRNICEFPKRFATGCNILHNPFLANYEIIGSYVTEFLPFNECVRDRATKNLRKGYYADMSIQFADEIVNTDIIELESEDFDDGDFNIAMLHNKCNEIVIPMFGENCSYSEYLTSIIRKYKGIKQAKNYTPSPSPSQHEYAEKHAEKHAEKLWKLNIHRMLVFHENLMKLSIEIHKIKI